MLTTTDSLEQSTLRACYCRGDFTPQEVVAGILERLATAPDDHAWISRFPEAHSMARARSLQSQGIERYPLYGLPFAVKDNIDVVGLPTTAACPAFSYAPAVTAPVVAKLLDAGAMLIGKTNMDQFATGLVGTRTPYGPVHNAFDPAYIAGGSSAGSAVAVAAGYVSFALGTDTAGSGRIPAAFNNVVGLKPTRGMLSTRGVVPACRSLDCVSIFALSVPNAWEVLSVTAGFDPHGLPLCLSRSQRGAAAVRSGHGHVSGQSGGDRTGQSSVQRSPASLHPCAHLSHSEPPPEVSLQARLSHR
jgi:allophanate hydrolase